jgi:hypothetical protein
MVLGHSEREILEYISGVWRDTLPFRVEGREIEAAGMRFLGEKPLFGERETRSEGAGRRRAAANLT